MRRFQNLLFAIVAIPLTQTSGWSALHFNKIPHNEMTFLDQKMKVAVKESSSVFVYKLKEPLKVTGFDFQIEIDGKLNEQNSTFEEDSYFRLGLVTIGKKTLNEFQRSMAADWVRKIFDLVKNEKGLDQVYFYNVATESAQKGKSRNSPDTDLIHEEVIAAKDAEQTIIDAQFDLPKEKQIVAIWLKSDGDNTDSSFQIQINKLNLHSKDQNEVTP